MARPGITYNEVALAIDALIAGGEEPTINRVREHLGTGSPNTVHRHLTAWRASRPVEQRKAPELPADLASAIVREIERQASEARSDVEKALVEAQKESVTLAKSGEEIEELNGSLEEKNAELAAERERLTALSDERHDEIKNLNGKLDAERKSLEEAHIAIAQGRNKIESLELVTVELKDRIKELSGELKAAEKGCVNAEKAAAVSEAKLESELKVSADLRAQLETMTRKHDELSTEARSLQKENHLLSDKNGSLSRDLKDCEGSHAIEFKNGEKLKHQNAELEAEVERLKSRNTEFETEIDRLNLERNGD